MYLWLTANLSNQAQKRTHNGRDYLVASASILVPGVLNGSKGALYYPPGEVARDPGVWNGYPLVLYHPQDPITGRHLSANDQGVLSRQGLGFIANDTWTGSKRRVEAWFDVAKTRKLAPGVLRNLQQGKPIELSTGLYTDNTLARGSDPRTGRPYDYIARNYRPDHLAILPDQIGACSVSDGCGINVNSRPKDSGCGDGG